MNQKREDKNDSKKSSNDNFNTRFITTHKVSLFFSKKQKKTKIWFFDFFEKKSLFKGPCTVAVFSPNSRLLATGSEDCSIKLLDIGKMLFHNQIKHEITQTNYIHAK